MLLHFLIFRLARALTNTLPTIIAIASFIINSTVLIRKKSMYYIGMGQRDVYVSEGRRMKKAKFSTKKEEFFLLPFCMLRENLFRTIIRFFMKMGRDLVIIVMIMAIIIEKSFKL